MVQDVRESEKHLSNPIPPVRNLKLSTYPSIYEKYFNTNIDTLIYLLSDRFCIYYINK